MEYDSTETEHEDYELLDEQDKERIYEADLIAKYLEEGGEITQLPAHKVGETQAIGGGKEGRSPKNKHFVSDAYYQDSEMKRKGEPK